MFLVSHRRQNDQETDNAKREDKPQRPLKNLESQVTQVTVTANSAEHQKHAALEPYAGNNE